MRSQVGLRKHHYKQSYGGDGIPAELFQILKDDAVKSAALNMPANLENSAVATGLQKVSFRFNPNDKECSNYHTIAFISHASQGHAQNPRR